MNYHVTCKQSKKLFSCPEGTTKEEFIEKLQSLFAVKIEIVQCFETTFCDDWVDHDFSSGLPPTKSKLNLILRDGEKTTENNTYPKTGESSKTTPQPEGPSISTSSSYNENFNTESSRVPRPYIIPRFPEEVNKMIANKRPELFSRSAKSKIIRILYEDISRYTKYPTGKEYDRIGEALIMKHPFMESRFKVPDKIGYECWTDALRTKFRHERSINGEQLECIKEMKATFAKRKRTLSPTAALEVDQSKKSVPDKPKQPEKTNRLSPMLMTGLAEDDESISEHLKVLTKELDKSNYNEHIVEEKMLRTASYRQNYSFHHNVKEVLEVSPLLKMKNMLVKELNLLYNIRPSAEKILLHHFEPIAKKIISLVKNRAKSKEIMALLREKENTSSEDVFKSMEVRACLLLLPCALGESMQHFFTTRIPEKPTPTLCFENSDVLTSLVDLQIENEIFEVSSVEHGITSMFAGYFAFQLHYPKSLKKTYEYLQKIVFKINPEKVSTSIINFVNQMS